MIKRIVLILTVGIITMASHAQNRPNIVLIMADDLGYSDIGCYGSDIPTPNIDALAANGLRFTQFYNTARCSPTRASLLTGLHPHQAGMGRLAEQRIGETQENPPGYLGYLNNNCATLGEVLQTAGYKTYVSGKWHLGMRDESKWPLQRGFDRFYGILSGGTNYFKPSGDRGLTLDNEHLPEPDAPDYYTTDAFTDFAIKTVDEHEGNDPFFLYLAYNAPHWPLQAKEEDISKFINKYKKGWDILRAEKFTRMKKLGILDKNHTLPERDLGVRSWNSLTEEEQKQLDYRMAVYAAQVHRMDWNIGRLVETLRKKGQLENTVLIFLSDNGACAEPYTDLGGGNFTAVNNPESFGSISYGSGWANLSNVPYRRFKSMLHEGGIKTPLVIHWPEGLKTKPGSFTAKPGCITDIMATAVELSGAKYPEKFKGNTIIPMAGESLVPVINNSTDEKNERVFYWEHMGYKAIRVGDMKAVCSIVNRYDKLGTGKWELYDIAADPVEINDLAKEYPEKLELMIQEWNNWANNAKVYPLPGKK